MALIRASCPAFAWPTRAAKTLREEHLFGPDDLLLRPLLRALEHPGPRPAVLLIDESTAPTTTSRRSCSSCSPTPSVTIPEIGTIRATHPPAIVLTSPHARPARRT